MASLPYGGRYRQVDFSLSNMTNSGIRHIGIITKNNYQSLMNHIGSGQEWDLELMEGGLEYLTPFSTGKNAQYRGKMEAIHTAMNFLQYSKEEYVVLVDSGVLCAMDFRPIIESHANSGADVTVVVKQGICNGEKQLDLAVKENGEGVVEEMVCDYSPEEDFLAGMGIFVVRREYLMERVEEAVGHGLYRLERDFLIPYFNKGKLKVNTYQFEGLALYNESTQEFFANSMALLKPEVRKGLFGNPDLTIYTKVRDEVPSYYGEDAEINDCIVADGCKLEGEAEHCILFRGVQLGKDAEIEDSIIMQDTVIGEGAKLRYVILDKDVVVPAGAKFNGTKNHPYVVKRGVKL
ncbi:MAG: glucose-1-phosphate adenylyltransferase subunit GlgD [Oscillospiraceae bacterium]|nr:glucose-1-phosphate adenylyltransferase subunit GlgD [Oscillospiraceae bacterium]